MICSAPEVALPARLADHAPACFALAAAVAAACVSALKLEKHYACAVVQHLQSTNLMTMSHLMSGTNKEGCTILGLQHKAFEV